MNKWLLIAVVVGASWFFVKSGLPGAQSANAFDKSGNPIVMVFTFDGCGGNCSQVTKRLKKRGVDFNEYVVDQQNEDAVETKLWKKMGKGNRFPIVVSGKTRLEGPNKSTLVSLLGENYGNEYLTRSEKKYFSKHFNDDGSPKIVMYGAEWCGYCKALKKEFRSASIDYLEIDVEKSRNPKKMSKVMGISGYPSTWVGYKRVNGTDLSAVQKTMDKS